MSSSKLTIITELVDRLTGPAAKNKKALEDLGKAAEASSKKSVKANDSAAKAEQKHAAVVKKSADETARAEGKKARAVEAGGQRIEKASIKAGKVQAKATADMGRLAGTYVDASGKMRASADKAATGIDKAMGKVGRSTGKLSPDTMAGRWRKGLDRMVTGTAGAARKINEHLGGIGTAGATAATGIGAMSVLGGVKRVDDVQQSMVVMEQMPELTEGDREDLMKMFRAEVQNSTSTTGEAAMFGSGLIAAGMDKKDVQQAVRGGVDAAALYGMNLDELAYPLKQLQTTGKLQGDVANMLRDRNMPIDKWLAEQKGVDQSKIKQMISDGKINSSDVFQAIADNTGGGAERAAKTFRGVRSNFMTSFSQAGEAFLMPLLPALTDALDQAKNSIRELTPVWQLFGTVAGKALTLIAPHLPVIVPLLFAMGGALVALKIASTVASGMQAFSLVLGAVKGKLSGPRGTVTATRDLGKEMLGAKASSRELSGVKGLGGLNDGLRTTDKRFLGAGSAARSYGKALGMAALAVGGLVVAQKALGDAMDATAPKSQAAIENSIKMGGDQSKDYSDAKWANGNSGSFWAGGMSGVSGIGDVVKKQKDQTWLDKAVGGVGGMIGYKDSWAQGFEQLSSEDSALAGLAGSPEAGSRFNSTVLDVLRAGGEEKDAVAAFPQYRDAVISKLTEKGLAADDSTVLEYMRSAKKYRGGGPTGMGDPNQIAGVTHNREFVVPERATMKPGNMAKLEHLRRTGDFPSGSTTNNVHVTVNGSDSPQLTGAAVAAAVSAELDKRARRSRNTHGTYALRGAN